MDEREMVVASHLGKTVGWGRSLKWADWVHVNSFVCRCLDSRFEVTNDALWISPLVKLANTVLGENNVLECRQQINHN